MPPIPFIWKRKLPSAESEKLQIPIWFIYIIVLLHQILSAFAFPIAKLGLNSIDPFIYAFFRFVLASIVYIPVIFLLRRKKTIPGRDHLKLFVGGLIIIPFNQVIFLIGQSLTSAGHSSLLFATIPIFLYILAIIFLGEKATLRRTIGILVAMVGVYIILSGGKIKFGREHLVGDILVLVAVLAWAVGTIILKPLAVKYGAFRVTGIALTYGSAVYFPFGLYRILSQQSVANIPWTGWFSVFYMAVIVSVIAYFLWYWALKYMEATRIAVLHNIQPIIATAVAAVILAEPVGGGFILGGVIVLTGVVLTEI